MQFLTSLEQQKIRASLNFLRVQQSPGVFTCRKEGEKTVIGRKESIKNQKEEGEEER